MNLLRALFLFIFLWTGGVFASNDCTEPYHAKEFKKLNYIYSSVSNESNQLKIVMCGTVSAPKSFVLSKLVDFKSYEDIHSFVKSVNVKGRKVTVKVSFLGFSMTSMLYWEKAKSKDEDLKFTVKTGVFKDMKVTIKVVDLQRRRSIVVMNAFYKYTTLNIPDLLIKSGINALARQLGRNMQNWLSLEYLKEREKHNGGAS